MLNLTNMVKAPTYQWRVEMSRCTGMNAVQNARKQTAYVTAPNEQDAKREAKRQFPLFHPMTARRT